MNSIQKAEAIFNKFLSMGLSQYEAKVCSLVCIAEMRWILEDGETRWDGDTFEDRRFLDIVESAIQEK